MNDSEILRKELISFYENKGVKISFLVDFFIDSVCVFYIKYNNSYEKVIHIKPKFSKKRRRVLAFNRYNIRRCMDDLGKKDKFELTKSYKEPFQCAHENNPFSGSKKQKRNKRR